MGLFSIDGPLVAFLNRLADLVVLNILTLICLLPFFGLLAVLSGFLEATTGMVLFSSLSFFSGCAVCAEHHCIIKILLDEDCPVFKTFFKSCRVNFRQGNLLWSGFLLMFLVLGMDIRILSAQEENTLFSVMQVLCGAVMLLVLFVFLYAFPLQSRYVNPLKATVKNAFILSVYAFPRTLLQIVVFALMPLAAGFIGIRMFPFFLLFGFSVPAYLRAKIYLPVLLRLEGEQEREKGEEEEENNES
ncbi:MAG: DUF624 domain-containing protein [Lachnospiraceae bacterium]|nr:DUF624 domain-containing protein [Lachnospiraceae bacterium]